MGRSSGGQHNLFVQIITGSGSHSSHGPILRTAVQKLLQKRGMTFRLEQGGGAFQVDALSGFDLYDSGVATDSKIVVAEQDDFHQLALSRKRNAVGNVGHASMGSCASNSGPPRTVSVSAPSSSLRHSNFDPLPSQVASADAVLRTATELSVGETQQQRNSQRRTSMEFERQFNRAVSESQLEQIAIPIRREAKIEEEEENALKLAYEQSLIDEQHHRQLAEKQYENTIMLAMEESTREANRQKASEVSEDDLVQQAMAESMALAEAEEANNSEDVLLEMALAESLMEEEKRKAYYREEVELATSQGVDILEEVKRLSLEQEEEEAIREEEALAQIIEMSKHMR